MSCWGDNHAGQLGDGTRIARSEARAVVLPTRAVDVEAEYHSACAMLETGAVYRWGGNDGTALWCADSRDAPAAKHLDDVVELDSIRSATCVRRSDRSVWCLGSKVPLYAPPPPVDAGVATRVPGLSDVRQVVAASDGACDRHDGGAVSCWGDGSHIPHHEGQRNGFVGTPSRVPLPGLADEIITADQSSCARSGGSAWCWTVSGRLHDLGPAEARPATP